VVAKSGAGSQIEPSFTYQRFYVRAESTLRFEEWVTATAQLWWERAETALLEGHVRWAKWPQLVLAPLTSTAATHRLRCIQQSAEERPRRLLVLFSI
jgi:hypothetical protein